MYDKRQALATVLFISDDLNKPVDKLKRAYVTKPINQLFPFELSERPEDRSTSSNNNEPPAKLPNGAI